MAAMESPAPTTVRVVDDERPLVRLVRSYLEREPFRVIEAFDGRHALDAARAERPDVIVLDRMLPGIDGLEVAREIRTFSDAYIIMLTARARRGRPGRGVVGRRRRLPDQALLPPGAGRTHPRHAAPPTRRARRRRGCPPVR